MAKHVMIAGPEEVEQLRPGQWAIDAEGRSICLADTHMGWPQRMWMLGYSDDHQRYGSFISIPSAAYPLTLADLDEAPCVHGRGKNEMGHCYRCGAVIAEPRPWVMDDPTRNDINNILTDIEGA